MTDAYRFVADRLWLLIAVVTLPLAELAELSGVAGLESAIVAVGWLLLTPVFLLFGDDIAGLVIGRSQGAGWQAEPDDDATAEDAAADGADREDPVETLKQRYARGELDEVEFERRLERLVALDGVEVDDATRDVLVGSADDGERDDAPGADAADASSDGSVADPELEPE